MRRHQCSLWQAVRHSCHPSQSTAVFMLNSWTAHTYEYNSAVSWASSPSSFVSTSYETADRHARQAYSPAQRANHRCQELEPSLPVPHSQAWLRVKVEGTVHVTSSCAAPLCWDLHAQAEKICISCMCIWQKPNSQHTVVAISRLLRTDWLCDAGKSGDVTQQCTACTECLTRGSWTHFWLAHQPPVLAEQSILYTSSPQAIKQQQARQAQASAGLPVMGSNSLWASDDSADESRTPGCPLYRR